MSRNTGIRKGIESKPCLKLSLQLAYDVLESGKELKDDNTLYGLDDCLSDPAYASVANKKSQKVERSLNDTKTRNAQPLQTKKSQKGN